MQTNILNLKSQTMTEMTNIIGGFYVRGVGTPKRGTKLMSAATRSGSGSVTTPRTGARPTSMQCYGCKQNGHMHRNCPTTSGSCPTTRGSLRGRGRGPVSVARKRTRSGDGSDTEVEIVQQGKNARHEWGDK